MNTYRIWEVVTRVYAYSVEANDEDEALEKIKDSCGNETENIVRVPQYDDTIERYYEI